MSERALLTVAAAGWLGATVAVAVPLWPGVALASLALIGRRPWMLCIAAALLASSLGGTAHGGLTGLEAGRVDAEMTLLTDPERFGSDVRVEVRAGRRHLEAWATGRSGDAVMQRRAGERLVLAGWAEPFSSFDGRRLSRHLAGDLEVTDVGAWRPGHVVTRVANAYRARLEAGTSSLNDSEASLLSGLVLGDDRAQRPAMVDAFRGSGLTHLLAVSGQNVAFVLLIVEPLARRLPGGARLVGLVAVLGLFGVVTRFEPSVLRATVMAGVAVAATATGRPASGLRTLALTVLALVLVDPLLVHSVGFQLSVAASAGIILWSGRIADAMPGPDWIGRPVGVIAAAQLCVAPILVTTFGPVPVASLPANLLAGPAAGPAMVWGMTAGVFAGALPEWMATLVHGPTRLLLGWIALIARLGAAAPLGGLPAPALGALLLAATVWRWTPARSLRRLAVSAVGATAMALPVVHSLFSPVPARQSLGDATIWQSAGVGILVVHDGPRPVDLLAELRRSRVSSIDLVAWERHADPAVLSALRDRFGRFVVLEPPARRGSVVDVGPLAVVVRVGGSTLVLDVVPSARAVRSPGALGARAPPL